ncbi:DUF3800 domain-containing protein [Hydrogenophaga flava]|uniref:DUF3800 domain-containing protein n=1 Tax=Hydrogenophaga flava TaxID=65657 RepID=UPI000A6840ED|nr:DUF3800 domain-containing protein [Hydrogenophaga flava]
MKAEKYWPIEEFAGSVLGGASKHKVVAVLVAYFDESGISSRDHMVLVGGAVADSSTWSRIERPWKKCLEPGEISDNGVSCFHAVDCDHGEREFASVPRPLRDAMAWRLSDEIGKIKPHCFAAGVVRKDWDGLPGDMKDALGGDPLHLSVALCIEQISDWAKREVDGEPVALVFAKQHQYNKATEHIHSEYCRDFSGVGSVSFSEPRLVIPLQVADFIAYESYRWMHERALKPDAEPRRLWKNLEKHEVKMTFNFYDKDSLHKLGKRAAQ